MLHLCLTGVYRVVVVGHPLNACNCLDVSRPQRKAPHLKRLGARRAAQNDYVTFILHDEQIKTTTRTRVFVFLSFPVP